MKARFIWLLMMGWVYGIAAQDSVNIKTSIPYSGLSKEECPAEFLTFIHNDSLAANAVLLVLNEALHPLGRYEFQDNGKPVKFMKVNMRMNRCTLIYIDTGVHAFHTMYQRLRIPVHYEAGKIYLAHLFSRKIWPIGGISIIQENEQGEKVEYAAVLFEYVTPATALELYNRMNKKVVIVNE